MFPYHSFSEMRWCEKRFASRLMQNGIELEGETHCIDIGADTTHRPTLFNVRITISHPDCLGEEWEITRTFHSSDVRLASEWIKRELARKHFTC